MQFTSLLHKNILLFVPGGKGIYGTAIVRELEQRGATVAVYDERPSQSTITKVAFRIAKDNLQRLFFFFF